MTELRLELTLLSDALPGSGHGRASSIDQDVLHDADGIPRLSGKTLKGLLREAYLEVSEWIGPRDDLPRVDELFGRSGTSEEPRLVVPDLAPDGSARLKAWLRDARRRGVALDSERTLATFTVQRTQTKIDPSSGAAAENTLRTSRLLRRGQVLASTVQLCTEGNALRGRRGVALACLNLRRFGTSRNRGWGRCAIALWSSFTLDADGARVGGHDELDDARAWLGELR